MWRIKIGSVLSLAVTIYWVTNIIKQIRINSHIHAFAYPVYCHKGNYKYRQKREHRVSITIATLSTYCLHYTYTKSTNVLNCFK